MKHLLTLLLATLCATGYGQTIKSLGFNTTNGNVVYTGTNNLFFTNDVYFLRIETEDLQITSTNILQLDSLRVVGSVGIEFEGGAAITRTNLGLGATWLTNDNVTNFRTAIGLGATNDVEFNKGTFNSIVEILEGTNVAVELNPDSPSQFKEGISIFSPNGLAFDGTNAAAAAATTRTNLGLGATWLTNTNASDFRTAIGLIDTNGASVFSAIFLWDETNDEAALRVDEGEINVSQSLVTTNAPSDTTNPVRWIKVLEGTNSYRLPLFQ